jgi:hypothetical protein
MALDTPDAYITLRIVRLPQLSSYKIQHQVVVDKVANLCATAPTAAIIGTIVRLRPVFAITLDTPGFLKIHLIYIRPSFIRDRATLSRT